jgi:CHAD domain-containing protein
MAEREAKLVVDRSFEVPAADGLAEEVASARTETVDQRAVYFDTSDLRLTRSGVSLRYRSDDGWTVKLPESRTASSITRTEHVFAGDAGTPPEGAVSLVRAWTRMRSLEEIATIDTRRHKTFLLDERGAVLAEVDDDEVAGTSPLADGMHFREIEVELSEPTPDAFLADVVRTLRKAGAEPTRAESKIARVLGAAAAEAPDVPDEVALGRKASVEDLVRAAFVRSMQQLLTFDPVLRLDDDDEAVHKARVATRRLRSDLRTLRPVVDRDWSDPLREELKWLGSVLGKVRDADVLLGALDRKAEQVPDEHRRASAQLRRRLKRSRSRDRKALLRALDSDRYANLLEQLVGAAAHPRLNDEADGHQRAARVARRLADKPRKRFRKYVRGIDRRPSDAELHEARKRAKQARYAHELIAPVLGKQATKLAKRFEHVQEVLGDHQDAVVAGTWLADTARVTESAETFAAGELAGLFLVDKETALSEWPAARKHVHA